MSSVCTYQDFCYILMIIMRNVVHTDNTRLHSDELHFIPLLLFYCSLVLIVLLIKMIGLLIIISVLYDYMLQCIMIIIIWVIFTINNFYTVGYIFEV